MYRIGSLFNGSGGFPLAASMCGIAPTWASEVEPYPIAVTRSRFPKMKHLGDISKVSGAEIEPVDVITFGSPCQDFSIAGKRSGLKHTGNGDAETTRSGLFIEAVRIIKEMRGATDGRYPSFALWENVPGAFSSNKGEDFRVVLEELIKIVEPACTVPPMPKGGWPYADCYMGTGWSLAYRLFDAQYWGVPQRRRRIHLVLDLRGERAFDVLFEREGVRGYFTKGGTPGQGAAADVTGSAGTANSPIPYTLKIRSGCEGGGKGALIQSNKSGTLATNNDQYLFQPIAFTWDARGNGDGKIVSTLTGDHEGRITDYTSVVLQQKCFAMQGFGDYKESDLVGSLRARDYKDVTDLAVECSAEVRYIVRRLTPTECARLQGFADQWGKIDAKSDFFDAEYQFWLEVRNTHAAINGKATKEYTKAQMLAWYNKLHTDSAEYKMWGNGIALPPALYVMQGIMDELEGGVWNG